MTDNAGGTKQSTRLTVWNHSIRTPFMNQESRKKALFLMSSLHHIITERKILVRTLSLTNCSNFADLQTVGVHCDDGADFSVSREEDRTTGKVEDWGRNRVQK